MACAAVSGNENRDAQPASVHVYYAADFYAAIYTMIGHQRFIAIQVCISMAASICGIFIEALLIVAEKETNEWRTLNRAGVSLLTLLGCKTVITVSISLLTLLACSMIAGYDLLKFCSCSLFYFLY